MHLCLLIYMMIGMHAYTQTLTSCKYSNTYIFLLRIISGMEMHVCMCIINECVTVRGWLSDD